MVCVASLQKSPIAIKTGLARTTSRCLALLLTLALCCAGAFGQANNKQKQPNPQSKKPQAASSEKSTGEQEKKAESAKAGSAESDKDDQEEAKGPWHGLTWRLIGPFRGGRVLAVSGVVGDPHTYYFGGVGGGVWKTTDGGLTWRPMTDKVKDMAPSIGAIAVAPSDANVIYAGTGEACIRGDIINGNGVYKSIDAGKTWTFVGLRDTRAIGRIAVHPKNPDIAYVAALGHILRTQRGARHLPHHRWRQDTGTKSSTRTKTPAASISRSIPTIPT